MRNALGNHVLVLTEDRYSKYPFGFFALTWEKYAIYRFTSILPIYRIQSSVLGEVFLKNWKC